MNVQIVAKKCEYCENRQAVKIIENLAIERHYPSMRKFGYYQTQNTKYWCDECWDKYDR